MKGRKIKEKEGSSRGMYIRSTSDIPPNWKDMRSIADITKSEIACHPFEKYRIRRRR